MEENKLFSMQKVVRDNCDDMCNYIKDLGSWEKEMKRKEKDLMLAESPEEQKEKLNELVTKAKSAKEFGNDYVKVGKWELAIEKYSEAIQYFPVDPIFYANRALCHLKLKQMVLAESDCDEALKLDQNYVKAYMRRAAAREANFNLKGALEDLQIVSQKEPNNKFAVLEINRVKKCMENNQTRKVQEKTKLDNETRESEEKMNVKKLKPNNEPVRPETEVTSADEIKNACGKNIIFTVQKPPHNRSKAPLCRIKIEDRKSYRDFKKLLSEKSVPPEYIFTAVNINEPIPEIIPRTSVKFIEIWKLLKNNPKGCHEFLKKLNGYDFANIFKESLEVEILSSIIQILVTEFIQAGDSVIDYIQGMTTVRRFSTLILFLSPTDKKYIIELIDYCINHNECSPIEAMELRKRYEV